MNDTTKVTIPISEKLAFENLLADLTKTFNNLPAERVEKEIERLLLRLLEVFEVDRCSFGEFTEDGTFVILHSVAVNDVEPMRREIYPPSMSWYVGQLRAGNDVKLQQIPDDLPASAISEREYCRRIGMRAHLGISLRSGGRIFGAIGFASYQSSRNWSDHIITELRILGELLVAALERSRVDTALMAAKVEIRSLKERMQAENAYQRRTARNRVAHKLSSNSARFNQVIEEISQVAPTQATVLLLGETGTGKEVLAGLIHELSECHRRPMIKINCAALPATLIEAELFGREKGAYTGALARQMGRFELAQGSTILLDEIGELPLELQTKLLRVLQSGEFERVGGSQTLSTDARIIAATNRDLAQAVSTGEFREDLYYRLNVFPIQVPPLRERPEDIALLAWTFVKEFSESMGKPIERISAESMTQLQTYHWPGNIRELRNVIERAMILSRSLVLEVVLSRPAPPPALSASAAVVQQSQRNHILSVLEQTGWRIRGKSGAAELLGVKPTTLESRMKKLGIKRPH